MGKGMKAGKRKPAGGGNKAAGMQAQLARLQAVQAEMEQAQEALNEKEITASSGGGAVAVTVNGEHRLTKIEIKPEVLDPEDPEMVQDLILTAANEALRQIDELSSNEMSKFTNGLGLPGMGF